MPASLPPTDGRRLQVRGDTDSTDPDIAEAAPSTGIAPTVRAGIAAVGTAIAPSPRRIAGASATVWPAAAAVSFLIGPALGSVLGDSMAAVIGLPRICPPSRGYRVGLGGPVGPTAEAASDDATAGRIPGADPRSPF